MSTRIRIRHNSRVKTQAVPVSKPFQQSLANVVIEKCEKLQNEIHKNNIQNAQIMLKNLNKDLLLLHQSHSDYSRLTSLASNTKANYYRKVGQYEEALKQIDQALHLQKNGNVDKIDVARTMLNKSVIMGQLARQDKNNLYTHQNAIDLAKEALQIIKQRPEGKQFITKNQYKLGEIIIISLHNIATELMCLKNKDEALILYKKAYDLAIKILGSRHSLTQHLKNIITQYKQENKKQKKRRVVTQCHEGSITTVYPDNITIGKSLQTNQRNSLDYTNIVSPRKNNVNQKSRKYKSFFKVYGYNNKVSTTKQSLVQNKISQPYLEMKDLKKIQNMYKNKKKNTTKSKLPVIERKNIKDIITQGKELSTIKPQYIKQRLKTASAFEKQIKQVNHKQSIISKVQEIKQSHVKQDPQKDDSCPSQKSNEDCQLI